MWSALWRRDLRQVAIGGFVCYQGRMNAVIALFGNLWNALRCVGELLGYLLRFVSVFFRSRTSLAARLLAAESQLAMCKRRIGQFGQGHLERLMRESIEEYYHAVRPHQGLDGDTPIPQPKADAPIAGPTKLISTPILGGLHHRYQRVVA